MLQRIWTECTHRDAAASSTQKPLRGAGAHAHGNAHDSVMTGGSLCLCLLRGATGVGLGSS